MFQDESYDSGNFELQNSRQRPSSRMNSIKFGSQSQSGFRGASEYLNQQAQLPNVRLSHQQSMTASDYYHVASLIEHADKHSVVPVLSSITNNKKKGYTFSLGREEIRKKKPGSLSIPGPGSYEIQIGNQIPANSTFYSMRSRTNLTSKLTKINPGPGNYEVVGLNDIGRYSHSKNMNSRATVFAPPSSKRFDDLRKSKQLPGPGSYKSESISGEGKYYNSKLKSPFGGIFSISARMLRRPNESNGQPGPGYYPVKSDFDPEKPKKKQQDKAPLISFKASILKGDLLAVTPRIVERVQGQVEVVAQSTQANVSGQDLQFA